VVIRFSENKYFSESALPTDEHIKVLGQFEASLDPTNLDHI